MSFVTRLGWPGFRPSLLPFWNLFWGLGLAMAFPFFPYFTEIEQAASSLTVVARAGPCHNDAEVEALMAGLRAVKSAAGLLVLPSVFTVTHRKEIIALAAQYNLPAVYSFPFFTVDGGLMSYGVRPR